MNVLRAALGTSFTLRLGAHPHYQGSIADCLGDDAQADRAGGPGKGCLRPVALAAVVHGGEAAGN